MNAIAFALASLLAATPFPPPKVAPVTPQLKCDVGSVISVDSALGQLRVNTPAGLVVYKALPETEVLDAAGKPAGTVSHLKPGRKIRIYYVIDDGAKVTEIDLE